MQRRQFLKKSILYSGYSVLAVKSLFYAPRAFAVWNPNNYLPRNYQDTLVHLFADREISSTSKLKLKAPRTAENGAVVPITITSSLDNIKRIFVLVEKNPMPLNAEFQLSPMLDVYIKARIKMAENSDIIVIAETEDKQLLSTRKAVKVSKGGCGG